MNSEGSTSLPWVSIMRTSTSNMPGSVALQARDRLLHQAEAVLHQRRLDVLHPHLVVGHHAAVGVGAIGADGLVAAARAAAALRTRAHPGSPHRGRHLPGDTTDSPMVQVTDTDLSRTRITCLLHARQQPLAPGADVVLVAALEQHEEAHAAEAPDDLLRMQGLLQEPRRPRPAPARSRWRRPRARARRTCRRRISARQRIPPGDGVRSRSASASSSSLRRRSPAPGSRRTTAGARVDGARFLVRPRRHDQPHARLADSCSPERQRHLDRHDACRRRAARCRAAGDRSSVPAGRRRARRAAPRGWIPRTGP